MKTITLFALGLMLAFSDTFAQENYKEVSGIYVGGHIRRQRHLRCGDGNDCQSQVSRARPHGNCLSGVQERLSHIRSWKSCMLR